MLLLVLLLLLVLALLLLLLLLTSSFERWHALAHHSPCDGKDFGVRPAREDTVGWVGVAAAKVRAHIKQNKVKETRNCNTLHNAMAV